MSRKPPPAFVALLQAQRTPLVRAARLLTGDWERAERLFTQVHDWALANWRTFEEDGKPVALMVRLRLVAQFFVDADLAETAPAERDADRPAGGADKPTGAVDRPCGVGMNGSAAGSSSPSSEEATVTIRATTSLVEALAALPFRDRAIVVGRYYLSLSAAEIGMVVGIPTEDVDATAVSILAGLRRSTADIGGTG